VDTDMQKQRCDHRERAKTRGHWPDGLFYKTRIEKSLVQVLGGLTIKVT